jgi:hypothetical protein
VEAQLRRADALLATGKYAGELPGIGNAVEVQLGISEHAFLFAWLPALCTESLYTEPCAVMVKLPGQSQSQSSK